MSDLSSSILNLIMLYFRYFVLSKEDNKILTILTVNHYLDIPE